MLFNEKGLLMRNIAPILTLLFFVLVNIKSMAMDQSTGTLSLASDQNSTFEILDRDECTHSISLGTARYSKFLYDAIMYRQRGVGVGPIRLSYNRNELTILLNLLQTTRHQHKPDMMAEVATILSQFDLPTLNAICQDILGFLNIDKLAEPLADYIIQVIHNRTRGDEQETLNILRGCNHLVQPFLAKHWYLRFGKDQNFIAPDLNFSFSIRELLDHGKLPTPNFYGQLVLSGFRIDNLDGLQAIPGIQEVKELFLSGNNIAYLPPHSFESLHQLEILYIEDNPLRRGIGQDAFSGLFNLKKLSLANNQLDHIVEGTFNGLEKLGELHLACNRLSELPKGSLLPLRNLQTLNLSGNQLSTLSTEVFSQTPHMQYIYLHNNPIRLLSPEIFSRLDELKWLSIHNTQLTECAIQSLSSQILSKAAILISSFSK